MKWNRYILPLVALCLVVACDNDDTAPSTTPNTNDGHGAFWYDDMEFPVGEVRVSSDGFIAAMLIVDNGDNAASSTYCVVGVHPQFEGVELDVEKYYHNDDYYFVFEDPVSLYTNYHPLRSGTIYIKRTEDGGVDLSVDVELADGKMFAYSNLP